MFRIVRIVFAVAVSLMAGWTLLAEEFKLTDGTVYHGTPSSFNEEGLVVRLDAGGFSPRVAWTFVPQERLKQLAKDPRAKLFVEPFIEIPAEVLKERAKEREIVLKPVPRLERDARKPGLMAAFMAPAGLFLLACLLAASVYAGYEVALYKHHPPAIVCSASAILPVIGPAVFLFIPPIQDPASGYHHSTYDSTLEGAPDAGDTAAIQAKRKSTREVGVPSGGGLSVAKAHKAAAAGPVETQIYKKPEFTFNRRFFETKFPGFFRLVPSDAEKDLVIAVRAGRSEIVGRRITRISMNEMHMQLLSGGEHMVAFADISEVQISHKDARV